MVVDDVFNLPRPVYDNALQVLYEILEVWDLGKVIGVRLHHRGGWRYIGAPTQECRRCKVVQSGSS